MVLDLSCIPAVVLIVEDEMMLRMRPVDMVEDAGYTPIEALDADEAVAILESRSDIALMCTDIQMPGSMDGLGLAHAVHARWPSIKIIVVSGQLKPAGIDLPPCKTTRSRANDCPDAEHDRPGLMPRFHVECCQNRPDCIRARRRSVRQPTHSDIIADA
jgi:CheY-like chemotaxis protein